MKQPKPVKKTVLMHELVRVVQEDNKLCLYIRMANGSFAMQRPYELDARGYIAALTLAVDIIAGKIILGGVVQLDERDFDESKQQALNVSPMYLNKGGVS